MVENSLALSQRLAQTQQALAQAQARVAELEACLMTASPASVCAINAPPDKARHFQKLLEHSAIHLGLSDAQGKILYTNIDGSILGYSRAEYIGVEPSRLLHPEDLPKMQAFLQTLRATPNMTQTIDVRSRHKAGHYIWVEITATNLLDDPDISAIVTTSREITARKQTEEALHRNRERYLRIVDDQLDLICRYNADFELTFVNKAYCAFFGKPREELLGLSMLMVALPAFRERIRAKILSLNRTNPVIIDETEVPNAAGERRWIQWADRALCDQAGQVVEYQTVGRDITDQKRLQLEQQRYTRAIEEMHQFLHSTLDAIAASVAVLERDGVILNVNEYWKHFGLANGAQSPTGYCLDNYLAVCDAATGAKAEEAPLVAAGIRAVIAGQAEQFYLEYPCHSPTEEHWYGLRVTPFAEPAPRRVVVAHINITERVQAEIAERQQRQFAEALLDSLAALTGALDTDQALQQILAATATVIPSEGGSIILLEAEGSRIAYLRGFSPEVETYFKEARFPFSSFIHAEEIAQGQSYLVSDTQATNGWFAFPCAAWVRSSIGAPIQLQGKVIGLICLDSATPHYFQPTDVEKLQAFAHYAGLALQNAEHVSQLEARVTERTYELQAAKEQVEAILNHSFDGILLVQPNLRIAQTNAAFNRMFASAPDDVFVGTLDDLIYLGDVARTHTIIQRVFTTQVGEQIEIRCYHKNGTVFNAELSIGPIRGDGMVCTLRNITARKQAEEALRASEALYRLLADNITDWISGVNAQMEFTYVSPSARTMGYEPDELLGRPWFSLIHPDDLPALYAAQMETRTQRPTTTDLTYRLRHKAGHYVWVETHGRLLYHKETGEFLESIGVSRDITARKQAEVALAESEARFRRAISDAPLPIMLHAEDGAVLHLSKQWTELTGYTAEELPTLAAWLERAYGHQPSLKPLLEDVYRDHKSLRRNEQRIRTKAEGFRIWDFVTTPLGVMADGRQIASTMAVDVTERKQMEEAVRESERRYRLLAENVTDLIGCTDALGICTYISPSCRTLLDYEPEELIGQWTYHLIHPDDLPELQATHSLVLAKLAAPPLLTYRMQHKAGHYIWLEMSSRNVCDPVTGDVIEFVNVARDITERKRIEDALRESEQKYRHLVEAIQGGIIIADTAYRTTYVNDRFCELVGYTRAEILGQIITNFVDAENAQVLHQQAAKRMRGENSSYEVTIRCKNGQPLHVLAAASPLRNDQQETIGTIAVVLDIETQKRAEAALRESLQKEKELGELKSRFVSMASHEFRTPLASILALTETLRAYRHKLADEQIDLRLGKIQEQIGYLKAIMEDVLQLARLQARRAEFNPAQLDLDALCRSILEEFQSNPVNTPRLMYHCDPALQSTVLDSKLIRQVFSNLVSNGLKYSTPDKPVTIKLVHEDEQLVLTVRDEGIGIPAADLVHLFEPFHRATNVGTISGTGLGLVITKESVELHGGAIVVESQVGAGTLVTVRIPLSAQGEKNE
ncbi:MAG: PAS domain S-box protein [Caldilineaceae bacterium]